jgi:hypothetical protein
MTSKVQNRYQVDQQELDETRLAHKLLEKREIQSASVNAGLKIDS